MPDTSKIVSNIHSDTHHSICQDTDKIIMLATQFHGATLSFYPHANLNQMNLDDHIT